MTAAQAPDPGGAPNREAGEPLDPRRGAQSPAGFDTLPGQVATPETEAPSMAGGVVVDASASSSSASVSGLRTASGSTSESRMDDLLHRLADADAITASRVRAWDRIQARRADQAPSPSSPQEDRRSGKGVRVCAYEPRPAAGADLTSSLMIRPTERTAAGLAAHAGTGGTSGGAA